MGRRAVFFVDANTIWHQRLAEAISEFAPTTGFLPQASWRLQADLPGPSGDGLALVRIGLPAGWASRTAAVGQRMLNRVVRKAARSFDTVSVVLTSPAYGLLSDLLKSDYPIISYTADDYHSYGWRDVAARERRVLENAGLRVFVSEALRKRAIEMYDLPPSTTFVSPNATEPRFGPQGAGDAPPPDLKALAHPILGVLGGVSSRLDLDFLRQAAHLPTVGTLLIAGPAPEPLLTEQPWLRGPKVHITGRLPHGDMHRYAHAMDAALIPYADTALNHFCSPMRLYDHLATGVPIFALKTCDQLNRCDADGVVSDVAENLLASLAKTRWPGRINRPVSDMMWQARGQDLLTAIETMSDSH